MSRLLTLWRRFLLLFVKPKEPPRAEEKITPPRLEPPPPPPPSPAIASNEKADFEPLRGNNVETRVITDHQRKIRYRLHGDLEPRKKDVWLPGREPKKRERKPRDPNAPKPVRTPKPVEQVDASEPVDVDFDMRRQGVEEAGTFYFRGALLDDLPKYFRSLRRLRGADPNVYNLCCKVGMSLIPTRMVGWMSALPPYWREAKSRPAFGAASFAEYADDDCMLRLVYFQRLEIPAANIEPTNGEVYSVTFYFDDENTDSQRKRRAPKWMRKHGFCIEYHVSVDDRGNVSLLKELQVKHHLIHYRSGSWAPSGSAGRAHTTNGNHTRKLRHTEHIPIKLWDYPQFLYEWHKDRWGNTAELARHYAENFVLMATFCNANDTGVRISIEAKDGMAASFGLDMKRSAYFFKDRDPVLTPQGRKARIFHVVRPHMRRLKDGRELALKMHFRGLRRFAWGDYQVHITVPGLHHKPLTELMPDLADLEAARALNRDKGMVPTKVFGDMLHDYLART